MFSLGFDYQSLQFTNAKNCISQMHMNKYKWLHCMIIHLVILYHRGNAIELHSDHIYKKKHSKIGLLVSAGEEVGPIIKRNNIIGIELK